MEDLYAINAAKTEFRECFNLRDPSRLLAIVDPDFVNFSDGQPCGFGKNGLESLKARLESLFQCFTAELVVIVIDICIRGDVAYDYGWHELTLTPKQGGPTVRRKDRYVDVWRKNKDGRWRLWFYMDNQNVADPFRPEEIPPFGAQAQGSF